MSCHEMGMACAKPCHEGGNGKCPFVENLPQTLQEVQALDVLEALEAQPLFCSNGSFMGFDLNLALSICEAKNYDKEIVIEFIAAASRAALKVARE